MQAWSVARVDTQGRRDGPELVILDGAVLEPPPPMCENAQAVVLAQVPANAPFAPFAVGIGEVFEAFHEARRVGLIPQLE